jgi:head-tail adaptor
MSFESLLIHTCNISRYTSSSVDDYGQPVKTWADVYTDLPCRLSPSGGREIKKDAEVVISDWTLHVAAGVTITERDRVTIGSDIFEVLLVQFRNATVVHHLELALQKVS